jgi:hypothetical protein
MTLRVRDPMDRHLTRGLPQEANASRSGELRTMGVALQAFGALALGAVAIGALAIGAVAIGRLAIGRARIRRLEIDELVVRQLRVTEELRAPPKPGPES